MDHNFHISQSSQSSPVTSFPTNLTPRSKSSLKFEIVTNLGNDGNNSLRDLLNDNVSLSSNMNTIQLTGRIKVSNLKNINLSNMIIEGSSLEFNSCTNIYLNNVIIRHTGQLIKKKPKNSNGLDCLNFESCKSVVVKNCSFWSSCDECISVVKSEDVLITSCLIIFPLGNERLHPYGKEHAECSNNSASSVTYHRCVFAYFRMRGPMFECNDVDDDQEVKMEVNNSVIYCYKQAGVKYHDSGPNNKSDYKFQILNNLFVEPVSTKGEPIVKDKKKGKKKAKVFIKGNILYRIYNNEIQELPDSGDSQFLSESKPIDNVKKFFIDVVNEAGTDDPLDTRAKRLISSGSHKKTIFRTWKEVIDFLEKID